MKGKIKWFVFTFCLIIFFIITYYVVNKENLYIDLKVYNFIAKYISEFNTKIVIFITNLGYIYLLPIMVIIMIIHLLKRQKITSLLIGVNLFLAISLNYLIKHIFRRERPISLMLVKQGGYSFPSGHTMASVAFYGFLIYLAYKKIKNKYIKALIITILSILIIAICLSRIYLGVHFTSDVLAGIMLSVCHLIVYTTIINKWIDNEI